ncbi:hypothetical protein NDU88_004961 [Pleurodeles waltl]|uniref:KRAB domain-containing protein n=1 Tax=Pleurodeles waltl TaxID=8319 RepID=A0AAV7MV00_PLEWA|nr:hypothetical protein NDU88_004961 [Pleurodeles waltl]
MFWQESDEVHVYDASAYFSEEEWKLLQDWQKELYRNVMKEIHQALASLGPLIASVFTLRSKEIKELPPVETTATERKVINNHSSGISLSKTDVCLHKEESNSLRIDNLGEEVREGSIDNILGISLSKTDVCLHKEEPDSVLIDNLGEKVREDHILGNRIIAFHVGDDEEIYCTDHQGSRRQDGITSHTGE